MASPLWRHPVTWRHRDHVQSINHGRFPIGCPLEPSRYLASFLRYLAPKLRQWLLRDDVINWRHQWRRKALINYPWGTYRHTIHGNILLKYRRIPTRIAGEEAFLKQIMTVPLWRHPVTWRHRGHVQSTDYDFLIRYPFDPSSYLTSFKRYLAPKLQERLLRDDVINDVTRPVWTIREKYINTPHRGTLC